MKFIDTLTLSMRMFQNRPMRTFLTILGVSVGIGAVLFLVSLGYGLQDLVLNRITNQDSLLTLDVTVGSTDLIQLDKNEVNEIKSMPNVEIVSPMASFSGQISLGEFVGDGIINSVDTDFFRLSGIILKDGEVFKKNDDHEIIISSASTKLFNLEESEIIGKKVKLSLFVPHMNDEGFEEVETVEKEKEYLVVGIVEDENMNYAYIPKDTITEFEIGNYDQLKVKVTNELYLEDIRGNIIEKGFLVSSLSDVIDQAKKIFYVIQIVLALFGVIALVVSAIGMFNTMTISLLERTNEIGVMRSIGVTKVDIVKMFLMESILMGFLGGVLGIIVGWGAGEIANTALNLLAKSFGGQILDVFYSPPLFLLVIVIFSTIIGLLTGIWPSIRAGRLNPLEALRYR